MFLEFSPYLLSGRQLGWFGVAGAGPHTGTSRAALFTDVSAQRPGLRSRACSFVAVNIPNAAFAACRASR